MRFQHPEAIQEESHRSSDVPQDQQSAEKAELQENSVSISLTHRGLGKTNQREIRHHQHALQSVQQLREHHEESLQP